MQSTASNVRFRCSFEKGAQAGYMSFLPERTGFGVWPKQNHTKFI
jgi:hypothetical protein